MLVNEFASLRNGVVRNIKPEKRKRKGKRKRKEGEGRGRKSKEGIARRESKKKE